MHDPRRTTGERGRRSTMLTDGALFVVVLVALAVAFACGRRLALGQAGAVAAGGMSRASIEMDQRWFRIDVKTAAGEVRIDPTGIQVREQGRR